MAEIVVNFEKYFLSPLAIEAMPVEIFHSAFAFLRRNVVVFMRLNYVRITLGFFLSISWYKQLSR